MITSAAEKEYCLQLPIKMSNPPKHAYGAQKNQLWAAGTNLLECFSKLWATFSFNRVFLVLGIYLKEGNAQHQ